MRLQVGIKAPPPLPTPRGSPNPDAAANELRGSYRFLSTSDKRDRADYTGLDGRSTKRKRRRKDRAKGDDTAKDVVPENSNAAAIRESDKTVPRPSTIGEQAAAPPSLQLESVSELADASRVETGSDSVPDSIMENILINCVRLNDPLGRYGNRSKQTAVTMRVEDIQSFVDGIVRLQYTDAVRAIKQDNAFSTSKSIQTRCNETVYWDVIKKGADLLDPKSLPIPKGPLDEFTMAEKVATEGFMREAGYGLSLANQRQCRIFWKRLWEMRRTGVEKILLYRTKEFDRFCKSYPSEAEMPLSEKVRRWEDKYGMQIKQLESRVTQESMGDFGGRLCLTQPHVAERLNIPMAAWNNAGNPWFSYQEAIAFQFSGPHEPSTAQLGGYFDLRPGSDTMRNKSIFVTILPKEKAFFSVCSIIAVQEGDFLGNFSGMIRYSGRCNDTYGIPGPKENLWLDYSTVTGTLNLMGVSRPGDDSNVRLDWELFEDRKGEKSCLMWKVAVRAVRAIRPFEELIRAAHRKEQYLLHQSPVCAKRGFMKHGHPSTE
ncbi:uncharacterized protein N7506_000031 [Penicillium brevicompactum]|uniref:uncharacterized protein n=1 Tax=Penicillium brevicompactum TaxID=5074 RepID=UPI00253FF8B6|nr:uncharacterized protein N7506_000031 [Penicillium brevicompactum]KAJ5346778.1 hypothetical protein N7506_000031 [Penicillium brevicompactum]